MHLHKKNLTFVVIVAAAAAALALVASIALGGGEHTATAASTPLTAADSAQSRAFGVTARPGRPADVLPADAQKLVGDTVRGEAGANIALSRRIGADSSRVPRWLVPGVGQLCLVNGPDSATAHDQYARGSSVSCVPTADAAAGKLVSTLSGGGIANGTAQITAVVPDGASNVQVTHTDGSAPTALPVINNVVSGAVTHPASLEFGVGDQHIVADDLSNLPQ